MDGPGNFIPTTTSISDNLRAAGNSMGLHGFTAVKNTAQHTGRCTTLVVAATAVFSQLAIDNSATDPLIGLSLPVGFEILGEIRSFTLTSGTVIAYHKEGTTPN